MVTGTGAILVYAELVRAGKMMVLGGEEAEAEWYVSDLAALCKTAAARV